MERLIVATASFKSLELFLCDGPLIGRNGSGFDGGEQVCAQQQHGSLATVDGPAMKACKILGMPFVTAINLLVHAVQKKWIPKDLSLVKLETLNRAGRYEIRIAQDARERMKAIGG